MRVWADGCFDLMHFGHANALRQAKSLGDYLVVGVSNDVDIEHNKGPTVMKDEERYLAVEGCKWVDQVVRDAPYTTQLETMEEYQCDFCVHGEDPSIDADGRDTYEEVKKAGRFRTIKRTDGISTTDIVGRMLLMTKQHHVEDVNPSEVERMKEGLEGARSRKDTQVSRYLTTSRKIVQFSSAVAPKEGDKIVYVDGAFDLFHVGHVEFLKRARALGDFLVVGVHDDKVVNSIRGGNHPILNLHERTLSVLSCKYVDEVIIGAPYVMTEDMIEQWDIKLVVHGTTKDPNTSEEDPYEVPRRMGIVQEIESPFPEITVSSIIDRVIANRKRYEERNARKVAKDAKGRSEVKAQGLKVKEL